MFEKFYGFLKTQDVEVFRKIPLSAMSSIGIGGEAELVIKPREISALIAVVEGLRENGIKYKIVGAMTNILPPDEGFDGAVVSTALIDGYELKSNVLKVQCGAKLGKLLPSLLGSGLGGYEELLGIPGCIGGLVTSNAGAFGKEIADILKSATVYFPSKKQVLTLGTSELDLSYRHSNIRETDGIVLSADLTLRQDDRESVKEKISRFRKIRAEAQPIGKPTLGSVFKRPKGDFAARMIDECGLKGTVCGGAEISSKHAGFIVNNGGATAAQVIALCELCEQKVYERFGVRLEREIEIMN